MPAYPAPLNDGDLANLKAVCESCHATEQLINDCKACGLPMDEAEAANNAQKALAESLRKKFFPYNA